MSLFFHILQTLHNPEKTRKFNVFSDYLLEGFRRELEKHKEKISKHPSYKPIRFSVVGTNGKGSTSHYLSELLFSLQIGEVGLYTSPHLLTPLERISCSGQMISDFAADKITESILELYPQGELPFTYFEFLTLVCLYYFAEKQCKYEVWEAGLGGRLDATKLVQADYVLITQIGLDHCEILGDTIEKIAKEKINICGPNTKRIFSVLDSEEKRSLLDPLAKDLGIPIHWVEGKRRPDYLEQNFHFAKSVLSSLGLNSTQSFPSIPKPKGRMELIRKDPTLVFDPAHNPPAVRCTLSQFRDEYTQRSRILLASLPDKDQAAILEEIKSFGVWEEVVFFEGTGFTQFPNFPHAQSIYHIQSERELGSLFENTDLPTLAIGSFRLYPILTRLFQKDGKM
ncbi:Mur ligase central domain protein [Leptospira ryugenii]|uniref:Mur ligase central domain protein n=1 Tax=Leptospira ryugenii TaxID=1917863 RepID=A0A2P2DZU4_9LEPT|nr:Mur ligase family protein [Leptospira ryugenii]GBF50147.1 Mur ligase central domain protein [Leptospira ryugenii]